MPSLIVLQPPMVPRSGGAFSFPVATVATLSYHGPMITVPESLLRTIVEVYAPRRVVLFGSQARGDAGPDSDIDLVVVLDDDAPPEALSWRRQNEARKGYTGSVDIIACREAVLNERARAVGSFADTILREGMVVYERH